MGRGETWSGVGGKKNREGGRSCCWRGRFWRPAPVAAVAAAGAGAGGKGDGDKDGEEVMAATMGRAVAAVTVAVRAEIMAVGPVGGPKGYFI